MSALIFDCDGVLSDTEQHGHLPAFNQTFTEFGLPVRWSVEDYAEKLKIGGGKERMASLLTDDFVAKAGLPKDKDGQAAALARWHKRKTEIYTGLVAEGRLPPRPGITRIIREALDAGWTLAVASTSAQASVEAILNEAAGKKNAARFAAVFAGDIVPKKKPAPDIYQLAIERLNLDPRETLVVEDSRNGLRAAVGAGLRCLVTVSGYTRHENFDEAVMVVSNLGDPGHSSQVLANRSAAKPHDYIRLDDLTACLATTATRGAG